MFQYRTYKLQIVHLSSYANILCKWSWIDCNFIYRIKHKSFCEGAGTFSPTLNHRMEPRVVKIDACPGLKMQPDLSHQKSTIHGLITTPDLFPLQVSRLATPWFLSLLSYHGGGRKRNIVVCLLMMPIWVCLTVLSEPREVDTYNRNWIYSFIFRIRIYQYCLEGYMQRYDWNMKVSFAYVCLIKKEANTHTMKAYGFQSTLLHSLPFLLLSLNKFAIILFPVSSPPLHIPVLPRVLNRSTFITFHHWSTVQYALPWQNG